MTQRVITDEEIQQAQALVSAYLQGKRMQEEFAFDCYLKFKPGGFEERDGRVTLPGYVRKNNLIRPDDPDELLKERLIEGIEKTLSPFIEKIPYLRIIASVNGIITVSVSK